jgi:hypothetical protein
MLSEYPVNPMLPWDLSLPLFVSDSRYLSLPLKDRRIAFEDYCKELLRAKRNASTNGSNSSGSASSAFRALLEEKVASTRMTWAKFADAFQDDPRFVLMSNDNKRQKAFDKWLLDLGEGMFRLIHIRHCSD